MDLEKIDFLFTKLQLAKGGNIIKFILKWTLNKDFHVLRGNDIVLKE